VAFSTRGGSSYSEYAGGGLLEGPAAGAFAFTGGQTEGAGQGISKQGQGKKVRKLGVITGGSFVADPNAAKSAPQSGAASAGQESAVAYTGSPALGISEDHTVDAGGTNVTVEDGSTEQAQMIADAVVRAKELVDIALAALDNPSGNTAFLNANFHTTDADAISKIKGVYNKVKTAFSGTIPVEVEADDSSAVAYVYRIWSDIHLCAPWFGQAADKRAGTIVHEMTHKYAGTDDNAYHYQSTFPTLSVKDAVNNADSYQWFCLDLVGFSL